MRTAYDQNTYFSLAIFGYQTLLECSVVENVRFDDILRKANAIRTCTEGKGSQWLDVTCATRVSWLHTVLRHHSYLWASPMSIGEAALCNWRILVGIHPSTTDQFHWWVCCWTISNGVQGIETYKRKRDSSESQSRLKGVIRYSYQYYKKTSSTLILSIDGVPRPGSGLGF